jgi:hypothetical protein
MICPTGNSAICVVPVACRYCPVGHSFYPSICLTPLLTSDASTRSLKTTLSLCPATNGSSKPLRWSGEDGLSFVRSDATFQSSKGSWHSAKQTTVSSSNDLRWTTKVYRGFLGWRQVPRRGRLMVDFPSMSARHKYSGSSPDGPTTFPGLPGNRRSGGIPLQQGTWLPLNKLSHIGLTAIQKTK